MTTLTKKKQTLAQEMMYDLSSISQQITRETEQKFLTSIHQSWNLLVKKALEWKRLIYQRIKWTTEQQHLHKQWKATLIEECRKIIHSLQSYFCKRTSMLVRKKHLLEELKDRFIYMKEHF